MHPILFKVGPLTVYSYGVAVAAGFILASILSYRNAGRFGIDGNRAVDLLIVSLVSGIIGARALYVALNIGYYADNPFEIIDLSKGGLVWYGGFIAALLGGWSFVKRHKLDPWNTLDLLAPYIALAQSVGRIGCYMNGCCYATGSVPVQLYSSALLFAIFLILLLWRKARRFSGEIFLGYCVLYSVKRFLIEFIRVDNPRAIFGLTISQGLSVFLFAAALSIYILKVERWKKRSSRSR
jgi:phosphatidylglycerol:prolipoprotein diacylglycerol transferase